MQACKRRLYSFGLACVPSMCTLRLCARRGLLFWCTMVAHPAPHAHDGGSTCAFCAEGMRHPLFAYMISDVGSPDAKGIAYLGVSSQPLFRLRAHNREHGYRCNAKSTARAKHWRLMIVVGPWLVKGACEYKREWRLKSRKLKQRVQMAVWRAAQAGKAVYYNDEDLALRAAVLASDSAEA